MTRPLRNGLYLGEMVVFARDEDGVAASKLCALTFQYSHDVAVLLGSLVVWMYVGSPVFWNQVYHNCACE